MSDLRDLSIKHDMPVAATPDHTYYPSIEMTIEQAPELKNRSVGDEVRLTMIGRLIGKRERDGGKLTFDVELKKVRVQRRMNSNEKAAIAGG